MSNTAKDAKTEQHPSIKKPTYPIQDTLDTRASEELVIAFSGPIGCDIESVIKSAATHLEKQGYEAKTIKLSSFIKRLGEKESLTSASENQPRHKEIKNLQDVGNQLREKHNHDILAQLAISTIVTNRRSAPPKRKAYLIDQLKHPKEASLLKKVYGNLFYMIGVTASHEKRESNLSNLGIGSTETAELIERDKKEGGESGQQIEKTLKLADYFIRNDHSNSTAIRNHIERFIDLLHGQNGKTPTKEEHGMYIAYSAGLKSACLSRQVGAAITDPAGNIISTGCNDVPKSGGGLYSVADGPLDHRCVHMGYCHNDHHKSLLLEEIQKTLSENLDISSEDLGKVARTIKDSTRLKDLIEFSRAVHAEMDAITSVARTGAAPVADGTLYSTTFPCHNCARHIVASGIKKVIYIEPYEKSLAKNLHDDSICFDPRDSEIQPDRVQFLHFEGVSPTKYIRFFSALRARKDRSGKALEINVIQEGNVIPEYLDSYLVFEDKVAEHVGSTIGEIDFAEIISDEY